MKIFPAIDILGGNAVRLYQGDYSKSEIFSANPVEIAKSFSSDGAKYLHIVDLDGARNGNTVNFSVISEIKKQTDMFVEVGGGIRNEKTINAYLELGINRVILGTIAVKDYAFTENMIKKYGKAIAVGVDAKDGKVAVSGWEEVTEVNSLDFCKRLFDSGAEGVIYTDVSRDGTLNGTNMEIYQELNKIGLNITASGGVTYMNEIEKLRLMNVFGVILGKALYAGRLNLKDVIDAVGGN